jgi:hypothetical protein
MIRWTLTLILALIWASATLGSPTWTNPQGGENVVISGDSVFWGIPTTAEGQSGLSWTERPPGASDGQPFILGDLAHINNDVVPGSAITGVDLNTHGITIPLLVEETLNSGPHPDDIISFPDSFVAGGITVLGFGPSPDQILPAFTSPEGGSNTTHLWGLRPIPAPGALVLAGIGCVLVRRRYG